ncbi:hypothetical protein [Thomasclavelia ramosa]|uniref:hypothetical protein n=2 Tax=Thomasclavelia ramosa TaxID=1547 RepID=UPI003AAE9C78
MMKMENKYQEALDRLLNDDYDFPHDFYEEDKATAMERDINTLQELVDKATPKKIIYEDIGYDHYKNVNVYGCICPSCGLHIIEFTDDDVSTDSDDIETMFNSSMVHHGHQGLNNFCNRCSQAFDWSDEDDR